ncbi:hypothetical protein KY290_020699 [Solanum tuberosum]|uniref:Pentatricopeptide repeat-containing protein n=1 Tax=Solanum tuberosum TaxID=4113 RepID=A0ABQ7V1F9_SOLTU|nr:hypothetical protein KY290_020699 [Solanum tuberosum]
MIDKGMKAPQLDYNKFAADFSRGGRPDILEELAKRMKFSGKFEVSSLFARWAEMMKSRMRGSLTNQQRLLTISDNRMSLFDLSISYKDLTLQPYMHSCLNKFLQI